MPSIGWILQFNSDLSIIWQKTSRISSPALYEWTAHSRQTLSEALASVDKCPDRAAICILVSARQDSAHHWLRRESSLAHVVRVIRTTIHLYFNSIGTAHIIVRAYHYRSNVPIIFDIQLMVIFLQRWIQRKIQENNTLNFEMKNK